MNRLASLLFGCLACLLTLAEPWAAVASQAEVEPAHPAAPVAAQQPSSGSPTLDNAGAGEPKAGTDDREAEAGELGAVGADTDPTKPVSFSFRNEFYDLKQGLWRNDTILRTDRAVIQKTRLPGRARGLLLRADLPVVTFYNGDVTKTGLGDLYGQALLAPRIRGPFFLAAGTGLVLPTATGDSFGLGKWIVSPAVVPVYFFPQRGISYIKVQDWISFAGSPGRPDTHFLMVTPTFLWRVTKRWYVLADGESLTDWEKDGRTSYKGGFLLGVMLSRRAGISLKAEIPFGEYRQGDWTLKFVFHRTRY
jgi:hypothetical protein